VTKDAFATVLDALARRDLTAAELEERLARAGFEPSARADALARAIAAGYLDDGRVALERARILAERDSSDVAIRADLERRDVSEELVDAALAAITPEADRAVRLSRRLGGGPRAARALARKGFPDDLVERVTGLPIAE
jgi:regulatory protein